MSNSNSLSRVIGCYIKVYNEVEISNTLLNHSLKILLRLLLFCTLLNQSWLARFGLLARAFSRLRRLRLFAERIAGIQFSFPSLNLSRDLQPFASISEEDNSSSNHKLFIEATTTLIKSCRRGSSHSC